MLIKKKESIYLTLINLKCVFSFQFYWYLDTTYFHFESCIGKIAVTYKTNPFLLLCQETDLRRSCHCCTVVTTISLTQMIRCQPLYNLINQRCLKFDSDLSFICVHESMIPYYGNIAVSKEPLVSQCVWAIKCGCWHKATNTCCNSILIRE